MKAKIEYQSVQIPKNLVEEIKVQISPEFWYRSHHEFIIESIRSGLKKLVRTKFLIKQLKLEVNNKKNEIKE